jgi:hypothetical protein
MRLPPGAKQTAEKLDCSAISRKGATFQSRRTVLNLKELGFSPGPFRHASTT